MELTAKEILKKNYLESIKGMESINTPHFPLAFEGAALAAIKEAVELAWQAGANRANYIQYTDFSKVTEHAIKDKQEFINSLFPESKGGIVVSNGITTE